MLRVAGLNSQSPALNDSLSKGWRSCESARCLPMWPWFISRRRCHMWVEFVVGSLLCSERFSSEYSGLPLSSKTNISKFQFDQESGRRRTTLWMCYLQIIIIYYLFIYLFITIDCFSQIQVSGNIPCRLGALLLTASNVRVLGGSVQMLEGNSYWNVLHQAM